MAIDAALSSDCVRDSGSSCGSDSNASLLSYGSVVELLPFKLTKLIKQTKKEMRDEEVIKRERRQTGIG